MRNILFRGKTKNGRWVYGDLWHRPYAQNTICIVSFTEDTGTTGGLEVMPETVGQYTGLKDKNGVKIFEGDILNLKYPRDRRYKVVAKVSNGQEISAMVLKFDNDFTTEEFPLYKISAENNLEVIGNVHDNPELVE